MTQRTTYLALIACAFVLPIAQAQERRIYWTEAFGKIFRGDDNGAAYEEIISRRIPNVLDIAEGRLYWADAVTFELKRSSLDGTSTEIILAGIGSVADLIVDSGNRKIYWIEFEAGKIWRANLDGTKADTVIAGLSRPLSLAIDSLTSKLYWSDGITRKVRRANLDGTQIEDVLALPERLGDIAIDANARKLYWIGDGIMRANLDGSNVETVLSGIAPFDFALDTQNAKIYLADYKKIARVNFDGTEWEELVTGFKFGAESLALDQTTWKIYWINQWPRTIQRANLDGTELQDILIGVSSFRGIALDVAAGKLYWTGGGELMRSNLEGSDIESLADVSCGNSDLSDIALDPHAGKLYWVRDSDCGGGSQLHWSNLDGSGVQYLWGGGYISSLALDLEAGKLYWADSFGQLRSKGIYRATLDGSAVETLLDSVASASGIAVDPRDRKIYWTEYPGSIRRMNFDGAENEIVLTGLNAPAEIALDAPNEKMYWAEYNAGKIRRANLDGTMVEDLFTDLEKPFRLALTFGEPALQVEEAEANAPSAFSLLQSYPNPFNPETKFVFVAPYSASKQRVLIKIYDLLGRLVAVLFDREVAPGRYEVVWNGKDLLGHNLPSGTYLYRLEAGNVTMVKRMTLLR